MGLQTEESEEDEPFTAGNDGLSQVRCHVSWTLDTVHRGAKSQETLAHTLVIHLLVCMQHLSSDSSSWCSGYIYDHLNQYFVDSVVTPPKVDSGPCMGVFKIL